MYYVLDENNRAKKAKNVIHWAKAVDQAPQFCHIIDDISDTRIIVRTFFTGLDTDPEIKRLKLLPFLWQTVISGGIHDQYIKRYCTFDDAVAGHAKAVILARSGA